MHPVIRVLLVLVTTGLLASGKPGVLLASLVLSVGLHLHARLQPEAAFMRMLARLRWFFMSLLALYGWFTPGKALIPALGAYSPTGAGLAHGLLRCAVLIVILSLVHWLTTTTARAQLMQAIYWLLAPLRMIGARPERVAIRLALVLEAVPSLQASLSQAPAPVDGGRWTRIVERARAALRTALEAGERAPLTTIEVDAGRAPGLAAWALLALLLAPLVALTLA